MGIFSSKNPLVQTHVLVVDIGTDYVRTSLVRNTFDTQLRKPEVLAYTETSIISDEFSNMETLPETMLRSLKHSLSMLVHKGIAAPDSVHCFLHTPWVASQTRIAKMAKDTPFIFTEKIAQEILVREREAFLANVDEDIPMSVIEEQIMSIKHNGYEIENPFGKKVTSIEASIFIAFSEKDLVKHIRTAINDIVNDKPIIFHSAHFSSFVTVRDIKNEDNEFLLLTIGGLMSHLSLVSNGHLQGSASFPHGTHRMYGDMASVLGRSRGEIASLVSVYASGYAHASLESLVKHSQKKAEASWSESFHDTVRQMATTVTIPETVYIISGNEKHRPLASMLFKDTHHTYALSAKPFNAILLSTPEVAPYIRWNTDAPLDMNTMLHSIFISRRLSQ